jgi:hypothetical protein
MLWIFGFGLKTEYDSGATMWGMMGHEVAMDHVPGEGGVLWQNHLGEGFVDQDQLERFLVKREHN